MKSQATGYTNYSNAGAGNTNTKSDLSKVLIGAVAGAAVGALVGGAFTEKGRKTTGRLTSKTKQLADTIKEKAESTGVADSLAHVYEAAKDTVVETISKEAQTITQNFKSNS